MANPSEIINDVYDAPTHTLKTSGVGGVASDVNLAKVKGTATLVTGTGGLIVGLTDASGNNITSTNNAIDENLKTVGGNAVVTVANGVQVVDIGDGTNNANVLAGDSGQNSQIVAPARKEVSFTTTTAQAVASTDVSNYAWAAVQITSQGTSSTVTFQASNDNINWVTVLLVAAGTDIGGNSPNKGSTTSTGIWQGALPYRYFRLNVTGISAGTTAGVIEFKTQSMLGTVLAAEVAATGGMGDAISNSNWNGLNTISGNMAFNGTTWDRQRGNMDNISLIASAAYTTTQTVADQTNYNARGVIVTLDVTTAGTGSITLEIDMKDPVSGKYVALLTGAAVTTNSTNIYTLYPGNTVAANLSASTILPRTWRVKVTANNANSITYSVGASLVV